MKVLIITDEGFENGGVSTYILSLKKQLLKNGNQVVIATSDIGSGEQSFSDFKFKGARKKGSLFWYLNKLFNFNAYFKIKEIINDYAPDIVHLHYIDSQTSPSVLFLLGSIPCILTLHDYNLMHPPGKKYDSRLSYEENLKVKLKDYISILGFVYEILRMCIYKMGLKNINHFITPSSRMTDHAIGVGIKPTTTIPNGICLKKGYPITNIPNLLFIGRLSKEKGIDSLIRSIPAIKEKFPSTCLSIIGEGEEHDKIIDLIKKLKLENNIKLIGKVENDRVEEYYKDNTVVIFPSVCFESFGLVGIEAMSIGRPVVGSNIGGIPEWLHNGCTGYLVEPLQAIQISERVIELLSNNELLTTMSKNSISESKKYSIEAHVQNLERLYSTIIKNFSENF